MRNRIKLLAGQFIVLALLLTGSSALHAQNALDLAGLGSSTPAYVAFSMRKLSTSYTGPALKVRRASDNIAQDINFTPGGELDVSALTTFIGTANAFVEIWYDQSGNGRNLTQPIFSKQPWIAHTGVVDTENGKPFIRFYGHNGIDTDPDRLSLPEITTTGHALVVNKFTAGADGFLLGHTSAYNWHADNPNRLFIYYASSSITGGKVWQNGQLISSPVNAAYNSTLMINSVAPLTPSSGTAWNNLGADRNGVHDLNLGGGYAEVITFAAPLQAAARISAEKNQGAFYGIAVSESKLTKNGALTSTTSSMVNSLGRVGQAALSASGQRLSINLPSAPGGSELTLNSTSATVKVTVNNYDGAPRTAGICWSTSSNPTISNSKTSDATGATSFTATATALSDGTTYYIRPYVTNSLGTTYGSQITFMHVSPGYAYLGGVVAYVYRPTDPGYVEGQVHGLIAATNDLGVIKAFGCNGTDIIGAEGVAFGTGQTNTASIIAQCGEAGYAAKDAASYSAGGYTDWFLPSIDELTQLFNNRTLIGNFKTSTRYWSSSESVSSARGSAQIKMFYTAGDVVDYAKGNALWVRAVRYF